MIVHFIGGAGAGKSTLLGLVAEKGGFNTPPLEIKSIFSPVGWLFPMAFPASYILGRRLRAHNRKGANGPAARSWGATIAMQSARRWVYARGGVTLVDQAMTNMLRKHASETAAPLVGRLPFPEMVVHVSAPAAVRAARVAVREKANHQPKYLAWEQALEVASARARQWNALWGAEGALRTLQAWNAFQCRPTLEQGVLEGLFYEAIEQPLKESDEAALRRVPISEQLQWLHDALVQHGVRWLNVVNDGREPIHLHARIIIDEIQLWRAQQ